MNSNHQNKNTSKQDNPPAVVHSTHSNMETFDQATREQENGLRSSGADTLATKQSATGSASNREQEQNRQRQEANTGVQLDRDVLQSRRIAADSAKVDPLNLLSLSFL